MNKGNGLVCLCESHLILLEFRWQYEDATILILETINRECNFEIVEVTAVVQIICKIIIFYDRIVAVQVESWPLTEEYYCYAVIDGL